MTARSQGRERGTRARVRKLLVTQFTRIGAGSMARNEPGKPGDGWADAQGMFLAEVDAGPVYRLLGRKDLGTTQFPAIQTALIDGDLGFRQHAGGHTPAPNWAAFLDFASKHLREPGTRTAASTEGSHGR